MTKTKRAISVVLVIALTLAAASAALAAMLKGKDDADYQGSVYPTNYTSDNSFFEDNPYNEEKEEWGSINPYFDELPETQNSSNFHSLGTATFENINGSTVTVDTLYRRYKESLNDPNYAFGILMYQTILYKIAHPEEHVSATFSSFHTSPTAALCINPNSPYYGYMISLYDRDYDENGFVRVMYLMVEAAKMGIEMNIIGHRASYGVKQYNHKTGEIYTQSEPYYVDYVNKAMDYECYDKYAEGKKVSDFLNFNYVKWDYPAKMGLDVMHVKTLAVSAYRDRDGVDHKYGVWFSSTNLDANNYLGCNGNGGSQSGLIVTGHKDIYTATVNFIKLTMQYCEQEELHEFRRIVRERNEEQIRLANLGLYDTIPENERIVYLGSETDNVFELYFTPFGGDFDAWDTVNNPYCKFLQKFHESDDEDVTFCWNNPNFLEDFYVSQKCVEIVQNKFITNKRPGNRISIRSRYSVFDGISDLKVGKDIEKLVFKSKWDAVHEKDILMSYVEGGERQYVTFHSSCNFNSGALYYQTNHILVVKETEETGHVVYSSLGNRVSKGVIDNSYKGMSFSSDERQAMTAKLPMTPITFETVIKLSKSEDGVDTYGALLSNNDFWNPSISYEINKDGHPQLVLGRLEEKNGLYHFKTDTYVFDNVNVATGNYVHLAFVTDTENNTVSCYFNGKLKQTISDVKYLDVDRISANTFVIGGSHLGSNFEYFKGTMYSLSIWADARTAEEIDKNRNKTPDLTDTNLMARYEFEKRLLNEFGGDMSGYGNDIHPITLWLDKTAVEDVPEDYYCFAVVPDTQTLMYYYTESMSNVYEWLVENRDEKNIKYVIGVGDITELSKQSEYDYAKEQIYKLDGKIPFSLVMGNHDKYDFQKQGYMPNNNSDFLFNKTFYNEQYLDELDGWYGEGDVSCSYNAFEVGATKWLLINLDFGPTDAMLDWAGEIIESHPDRKVIIATHAYLYRNGTTLDKDECYPASGHNSAFNDGDEIYDKLVSKYENVELVLCGHDPWDHIVCNQQKAENGNTVTELLIDAQYMDKYYGATEMIAMLYFSPDGKTMTVRYYSIAKDMYGSELSQFRVNLD